MTALPAPLDDIDLPLPGRRSGKVRVSYDLPNGRRLFVTTDRLSAFDRIIGSITYKGQVLNELSAWWFEHTADVVDNHLIDVPDPNVLIAHDTVPLPVEVVVRRYITGVTGTSLWTRYAAGAREIDGHRLPDGLRKNAKLPAPIITPTTKGTSSTGGASGVGHDVPLSCADVVDTGLVDRSLWAEVCDVALEVFRRGTHRGRDAGLILADTKYEFGVTADGRLLLIDEVHTPDSSRWWVAATYHERMSTGREPESLDKEVVRRALADAGFTGDGPAPALADEVREATTRRYVDAFERLTGTDFQPGRSPIGPRITAAVAALENP